MSDNVEIRKEFCKLDGVSPKGVSWKKVNRQINSILHYSLTKHHAHKKSSWSTFNRVTSSRQGVTGSSIPEESRVPMQKSLSIGRFLLKSGYDLA